MTGIQEANVKRKRKIHVNLTTALKTIHTPPINKKSYTNSPSKYKTTLKPKLLPFFVMNDKG